MKLTILLTGILIGLIGKSFLLGDGGRGAQPAPVSLLSFSSPRAGGGTLPRTTRPSAPSFEHLLDAIEQVESGGDASAIGDGGMAVGAYQLWPVYVQDANRIAGTHYTLQDRYDRDKSREMTRIVLEHYNKGMPKDKWAVIHLNPSKRMDWNRPAAVEYLRKISEVKLTQEN